MRRAAIQRIGEELPEWLAGLSEYDEGFDGVRAVRVRELLPRGYERYLRLFHPFLPWKADPSETDETEHRTWQSLAQEAGTEFSVQLTWGSLESAIPLGPKGRPFQVSEGTLDPNLRRHLFAILEAHTNSQPSYFYFGLSAIFGGDGKAVLLQAPLSSIEEVCALARSENWPVESPEYVWPEDRSWVLCTSYDLSSSYIAGSKKLATEILAEQRIESIAVSLETRVDNRADEDSEASRQGGK